MATIALILCMLLAQTFSDGDAMVLLVLGIPALLFWALILWVNTGGQQYDQNGNKVFDEDEE